MRKVKVAWKARDDLKAEDIQSGKDRAYNSGTSLSNIFQHVISKAPDAIIDSIGEVYDLKSGAEELKIFLGAIIEKFQLQDGQVVWSMSSNEYIANAVRTVKYI
eukprot:8300349-Ditylum_brightwellii.AAC.1